MIIKFIGMTLAFKYLFKSKASSKPKKAPTNKLGAKTPPSPPAASEAEVAIGFNNVIPKNVNANDKVNTVSFESSKTVLIA